MADTRLFSRLKRLFSTDVIIRNQGGNQLRVMDVNKIQSSGEYENNAININVPEKKSIIPKISANLLITKLITKLAVFLIFI